MTALARELHADVPLLAAIARRLCRNPFDADDLVQDTLERALRAGAGYMEQGKRRSWLAMILRNRFYDRCRAARARAIASAEVDEIATPDPTEPPPWEHITAAQIREALAQLDPPFRRVYELHASGRAYAEIASELGISINTVGTRLVRARSKLRLSLNSIASVC
jgi:RNA polymerase sigma-70 factor, ECF subfamily